MNNFEIKMYFEVKIKSLIKSAKREKHNLREIFKCKALAALEIACELLSISYKDECDYCDLIITKIEKE